MTFSWRKSSRTWQTIPDSSEDKWSLLDVYSLISTLSEGWSRSSIKERMWTYNNLKCRYQFSNFHPLLTESLNFKLLVCSDNLFDSPGHTSLLSYLPSFSCSKCHSRNMLKVWKYISAIPHVLNSITKKWTQMTKSSKTRSFLSRQQYLTALTSLKVLTPLSCLVWSL